MGKQTGGFAVVGLLIVLILGVAGFFAYQNFQLKQQATESTTCLPCTGPEDSSCPGNHSCLIPNNETQGVCLPVPKTGSRYNNRQINQLCRTNFPESQITSTPTTDPIADNRLFNDVDSEVDLNKKEGPWIVRQRAVDVQMQLLKNKNLERITLNLFNNVTYEVEITSVTDNTLGVLTLTGDVVGFNSSEIDGDNTVVISVSQDAVTLSVSAMPGVNKHSYKTQSIKGAPYFLTAKDYYLIYEIDNSKYPPD